MGLIILFQACASGDKGEEKSPADDSTLSTSYAVTRDGSDSVHGQIGTAPVQSEDMQVRVFPSGNGYGYEIVMNGKPFIRQETIPAVQGNQYFHTEAQARLAGEFILGKIKNNILPPSVTVKELDSLGVLL